MNADPCGSGSTALLKSRRLRNPAYTVPYTVWTPVQNDGLLACLKFSPTTIREIFHLHVFCLQLLYRLDKSQENQHQGYNQIFVYIVTHSVTEFWPNLDPDPRVFYKF